jgi:hypothetical protein
MKYLITENKNIVLGPMDWRTRTFQSEMEDLEVDYQVSPNEGYYQVNDEVEIYPITASTTPSYDADYQQLQGPFYTFDNQEATETYSVIDQDVNSSKNKLKTLINTESTQAKAKKTTVEIQGTFVTISTASIGDYTQQLALMGDSINWKFPEGWLVLSKVDLELVIVTCNGVIQSAFDVECAKHLLIDSCDSIDSLRALNIVAVKLGE